VTGKESYKKEALIKRVVATEGDVVEIKNKVSKRSAASRERFVL